MQATPLPAWPLAAPVAADRGPRAAADPAGPGEGPAFGEQLQAARRERTPAAGTPPGAPRSASAPARPSAPGRAGTAADAASSAPAESGGEETPDDAVEALAGHRATARLRAGTPSGGTSDDALGPGSAPPAAAGTPAALALRGARALGAAGRQEAGAAALEGQTGVSGTPGAAGRLGSGGPALSSSAAAAASWRAEQDAARAEAHEAHESREALALAAADRTIAARLGGDASPAAGTSAAGGSGAAGGPGAAAPATPGALSPLGTPATPGALASGTVPANGAEPPTFLLSPPLDSPTFAPALGLQLSVLARDGIEQARMQLNPESMGPISVQLSVAGTQVNIDFVASQAPTREALQQSMPELASAMRDAGFTLTGGGVFQQARDGAPGEQAPGWPGLPGAGPNAAEAADAEAEGGRLGATRRVTPRGLVDVYA